MPAVPYLRRRQPMGVREEEEAGVQRRAVKAALKDKENTGRGHWKQGAGRKEEGTE